MRTRVINLMLIPVLLSLAGPARGESPGKWLVHQGRPRAVIVAGDGEFYHSLGVELQRYFRDLSGVRLETVKPDEALRRAKGLALVLIGGPKSNPCVEEAASEKLVSFDGLKADGFIIRTIRLGSQRALVIGGNDEASTMYAVYDLLERYGAVFLITGDILPEKSSDLELRDFNVRKEPAFARRGLEVASEYESRSIMSLAEQHKFLDQMAKLKFNYLMVDWLPYEVWLKYEYHGEAKRMGDVADRASAYMLWARDFGRHLTSEMAVGREHFKAAGVYPRLAPPEFQHIENNEQAFEAARKYLQGMISYAAKKKIKVWLGIDATSVSPNLARYTTRTLDLPFDPIFGTFMCADNPVSLEINENRLKSLVQTYPEAAGYTLYFPEAYPVCNRTANDREFYFHLRDEYAGEADARDAFTGDIPEDNDTVVDSNSGSVYFIHKLVEARDQIAPGAKLGIGGIGRLYLWPLIDKLFPKDMPFADFESSAIWTPTGVPMELFGRMKSGRPKVLINRIDDDSAMLGMQFNVNLYYKDQVLEGGLKNGLAGFASQINRDRGTEQNTSYMAEGEWEPHLTPEQFYRRYTSRMFGEKALGPMLKAFHTLEKNEQFLGWTGRENFPCCGPPPELSIVYEYSKQPDPFDGPRFAGWRPFLSSARDKIYYYSQSIKLLDEALQYMRAAQPLAAPRSEKELAYLINKTEAYKLHLQTLILWNQAYIDFDNAFQTRQAENRDEFLREVDASLKEFEDTRKAARNMAQTFSEIIDSPSDLGVLYRINAFMVTGTELAERFMQNIDNFYHGLDYLEPVDWGKVFVLPSELATVQWQSSENVSAN